MRAISAILFFVVAGVAVAVPLPHFTQPNAIWNEDVSLAPTRMKSGDMMLHLEDLATQIRNGTPCYNAGTGSGCWGDTSNHDFHIDFSIYVLHADGSTPTAEVIALSAPADPPYYYGECDDPGPQTLFPVPVGGGIEGTGDDSATPPVGPSYTCNVDANDCHLLVGNDSTDVLWEAYNAASVDASGLSTRCALHWYLDRVYPRYGRGEHCTSADGAGFPIAPLLFNADEVWTAAQVQGDLGHAIRFVLGNNRMMKGAHVHPSSHGTSSTSDLDPAAVPYGSRLRLKSTFDVNAFSPKESVRAILRTLQKYGMFLSDGGGIPLTAESDYFDDHKWSDADMNIDSHSLFGIRPTDFDVVESGDAISNAGDCSLTPEDFIFIDGNDY